MRITKSQFLQYLSCPTSFWYYRRNQRQPLTVGEEVRIAEGREIGERARKLFVNGTLISESDIAKAATQTQDLMKDLERNAIFEGTFISGDFVTRADILLRDGERGWRLIEVKSSLHQDDHVEEEHISDLAYTAMVAQDAGVVLTCIELMRISRDWRLGHNDELLFERMDCSVQVQASVAEFRKIAPELAIICNSHEPPEPRFTKICRECPFFATDCLGVGVEHPIFEVPRLSETQFNQLHALGVLDVSEIPDEFRLTENQRRVVDCIKRNEMQIDFNALGLRLNEVRWPCYYLDFETAKTAIPFWNEIGPHEQILTQFSLHVADGPSSDVRHFEYLSPHTEESTDELLESLLAHLGEEGSIVVYSSFEKTQITKLATRYPEKLAQIQNILNRLFDLEKVFKEAIRHPLFRGRTSIKKTLPALVPTMTYDGLPIGNGDSAVAAFVKMAKQLCSEDEVGTIRRELLRYCHQDTLAMVELHRVVIGLALAPEKAVVHSPLSVVE
jgi:CRISPR/Cas system-associated exonuclease Cas4 (RecB family)